MYIYRRSFAIQRNTLFLIKSMDAERPITCKKLPKDNAQSPDDAGPGRAMLMPEGTPYCPGCSKRHAKDQHACNNLFLISDHK